MTKFTAFVFIVALRIFYHPSHAPSVIAPFTSASPDHMSREASPFPPSTNPSSVAKHIPVAGSTAHLIMGSQQVKGDQDEQPFDDNRSKRIHYCRKGRNKPGKTDFSNLAGMNAGINNLYQ